MKAGLTASKKNVNWCLVLSDRILAPPGLIFLCPNPQSDGTRNPGVMATLGMQWVLDKFMSLEAPEEEWYAYE